MAFFLIGLLLSPFIGERGQLTAPRQRGVNREEKRGKARESEEKAVGRNGEGY
jgi:hypothetical protein